MLFLQQDLMHIVLLQLLNLFSPKASKNLLWAADRFLKAKVIDPLDSKVLIGEIGTPAKILVTIEAIYLEISLNHLKEIVRSLYFFQIMYFCKHRF